MKTKIFTLLFAIMASVGSLFAASGTCGDNLTWDLTGNTLTISGTGPMTDYNTQTSAPWDSYSSSIKTVIIKDGVTKIGSNAFYVFGGYANLTSVNIPNSVTTIGSCAFKQCTGLTSVTIPNSVTTIGSSTFENCIGLTSVTIPNSVITLGKDAFSRCSKLISVTFESDVFVSKYYTDMTHPCGLKEIFGTQVKEYILPENVERIGTYVFSDCTELTSIVLPNTISSIGNYAFYNCKGLSAIIIPDNVTSIGNYAFFNCFGVTSIEIPNKVTSIGDFAFRGCGMTSIIIPANVSTIGKSAFIGSKLKSVYWNVPNAEILASVFPANLDSLIIGENVEEVGLTYQPQNYFELLNPLTRVRMCAAPKLASFYDYNHDGTMEFADTVTYKVSSKNYYNVRFKNLYGFLVSDNLLDNGDYMDLQTINLNNDTLIDFILGSTLFQATDNGGYDKIELDFAKSNDKDHLFALDADLNGTIDFYSCEEGKHYFHLRQFDGSYLKIELNIISEQAEVDSAIYAAWNKPQSGLIIVEDHYPALKETMFIPNVKATDNFQTIDMAIDLDKNGLVDLLSSSTGVVLYNMGNNTFLRGRFPGAVTVKDMNNDGIEDFVIYDKSTKTVSLQIYNNNGQYKTITMMQNLNISDVWCYDFDSDGDVDILLSFDWTSSSGYAYLVFFRNDGNSTFKKVETAFDDPAKHFQFLECRDVDNDGKYEIIARDSIYGSSSIGKGNYYLIRYTDRLKATMDAEPFAANTLPNFTNNFPFIYGDFNNDGNNECYYYDDHVYKYSVNGDYYYVKHHAHYSPFANNRLNTPPSKMSTPRVVGESSAGKLLISWDSGSDVETSNIDLVYSLRIGSAPGLSDMWYASALDNGKQTALNSANVGSHLSQIVNISGWKTGDYYIAVQAIDPNGLGGAWSDEVVYHHSLPSPSFNTNIVEGTTADTILVKYAGMVDNTATYIWNFGDSAVVLEADETKQAYKIVYNTAGTKTISLQVEMADGRTSDTYSAEIKVYPMKLEKDINYYPGINFMSYFDMDMDGQMDALGYYSLNGTAVQGFFKGKADGSFIKLAKTYNSDLTVNDYQSLLDSCIFADFNMDGLPDVQWSTNKGTTMYNMEDFDVEFSDEIFTLPYTEQTYDFNGDGIDDEVKIKNTYALAIILNGPHKDTIELDLPNGYTLQADNSWGMRNPHIYDIDNNGFLDFVVIPKSSSDMPYIIYLNEDWSFYCQNIPQEDISRINKYLLGYPFVDLNSDGTPDFRSGYFMKSRITNEAPAVPTNLRAVQNNDGVYLYWDAAKDKETPAARMRYNISVKKQGVAVGTDNAFVVSPMNGLYDEANIVPGYIYPHGTSYFIPLEKLTGGQTYEFQIQSIDLWNAHSPMSAVYTFTVQPQVLITMPAQTCINTPVTVAYTGTNNGGISWNFDGGVSTLNTDGTYSVYWSQEGLKTVTATLNGNNTASRVIYVQNAQKDLSFTLPERVLNNSWTQIILPANYENLDNLAIRTSSNCTGYILPKKNSRIFQVCFNSTSADDSEIGWVEFYQNDAVCGEVNNFRDSTSILAMGSAPAISLVMVDATTGKNMVTWDAPANLPTYVDSIVVYKEEGATNNWVMQAKVSVANGQWIDNASDPSVKSNKYCITYTSIYGGESPKSTPHQTPHLQTNYGLNGVINLYWTYYQGDVVNSYLVLRGTSAADMQILTTVAGDECTFTDNNPVENAYYAIAYTNADFENEWVCGSTNANAPSKVRWARMRTTRNGHSNIMKSAASAQATLVQSLNILSMEREYTLSLDRTTLHLYAEISPTDATYKQMKWCIVSGSELATVNSNGLLMLNPASRQEGTVRVRATAIDGSGVYAEREITISLMYFTICFWNWDGESLQLLQKSKVLMGDMPVYEGETPSRPDDDQYTYIFSGWSPTITPARYARDYIAQYDAVAIPYFTIRFLNWNGDTLQNSQVKYGIEPEYAGEVPTKPATTQYSYRFKGWKPAITIVNADATYTAEFDSVVNMYLIIFNNDEGIELKRDTIEYGTMPIAPTHPTKASTAQYEYTFDTWSPEISIVTGNATYTATYTATLREYVVSFLDDEERIICSQNYQYGQTPIAPANPSKPASAEYTYTFAGWAPEVVAVTGDATYRATFIATKNSYTITWQNEDGSLIDLTTVEYGVVPTHADPVKENTAEFTYTFTGWTPEIVTVTGNATYRATFNATKNKYLIIFRNDDGTELKRDEVEYGIMPIAPANPIKESTAEYTYTFAGWTPSVVAVTGDATYRATFNATKNSYTITWLNDDGSLIDQTTVEYGEVPTHADPIKENTAEFTYTFAGWTPNVVAVTGDATYRATFNAAKNSYTITWLNEDGSLIDQTTVEYGVVPTHADPVKANTAEYTYMFAGWTPTIVAVTSDAAYRATFNAAKNSYTITWLNEDGSLIDQTTVEYGVVPTHADPVKANTAEYTYTFAGWTPEIVAVTGDATYRATFSATKNSYTITWLNEDSSMIDQTTVEYGVVPTHADPVKENTAEYTYTFAGWTPEIVAVTGDATYRATFNSVVNVYTITVNAINGEIEGAGEYAYGTEIELKAIPTSGYKFDQWSDGVKDNPRTIIVTGDAEYTAIFIQSQGINDVYISDPARKVIIDDKIFILRGEKVYTVTGQEVK